MFTAYLDDSGTEPNARVAIATAYIIPTQKIKNLESEWSSFCAKEGFSSIHTSELVALNKNSEYAKWDRGKQAHVLNRVRQITLKYGVARAFSFAANKKDYEEIIPKYFRGYIGMHAFTWAARQVISQIDYWHSLGPKSQFEFVFDWMGKPKDERRIEIEKVMEQSEIVATERGNSGLYRDYRFGSRKDTPGLQCVDVMSWTCYQQALLKFYAIPMKPFAADCWKDYGGDLGKEAWLQAITVKRDNLKTWIEKEISHGKSIERFQQMEKGKRREQ
jgi:hypothetical protein